MPIAISCPSCSARLQAPDSAAGKRVKCPKCQEPIPVPGGGAPAPAPAKAAPKKPAPSNDFDFEDEPPKKSAPAKRSRDDDYDDDPPPKKSAPSRSRDDDYDDDPPPKKGGAIRKGRDDFDDDPPPKKSPSRRDDYDDDFDDDRPKAKKGRSGGGGNFPRATEEDKNAAFQMYLFAFLANLFVGGAGTIVFFVMWMMKRKDSPLVDWHGKQFINSMISSFAALFVLGGIGCAGSFGIGAMGGGDPNSAMPLIGFLIGLVFFGITGLYVMWLGICFLIAMFKAKAGEYWKYPLTLQLLK